MAHKKGVGSSKTEENQNRNDLELKSLEVNLQLPVILLLDKEEQNINLVIMYILEKIILFMPRLMVLLNSQKRRITNLTFQ